MRKPFYRKSHSCWYIKDEAGKFIRLDPEEKVAFELWRQMLEGRFSSGPLVTLRTLAGEFLRANMRKRDQPRFKTTVKYLQQFLAKYGSQAASTLTEEDMYEWLLEEKDRVQQWAASTQLDALNAVSAMLNWAVRKGKLASNPIDGIERPEAESRSEIVEEADHRIRLGAEILHLDPIGLAGRGGKL